MLKNNSITNYFMKILTNKFESLSREELIDKIIDLESKLINHENLSSKNKKSKKVNTEKINNTPENLPIPIVILNQELDVISSNSYVYDMLKIKDLDTNGLKCKDFLFCGRMKNDVVECPLIKSKGANQNKSISSVFIKDACFYSLTCSLQNEKESNQRFVVQTISEISEIINNKRRLEKDLDFLNITLQSIGDGVITTDANGNVTNLNSVAESLTGWSLIDALNKPIQDVFQIFNCETRTKVKDPVSTVLKTRRKVNLSNHTVLISKEGLEYHISDSAAPILDKDDSILGVILVFSDVSEKYQIEQSVRESEKRYRALVDEMKYGLALHEIITDDEGRVVDYVFIDVNPAYEKQTGLLRQDIIGKRVLEVLPEVESYWIEKFGYVALHGESLHYENYVKELDKYFEVVAYRPGKNQFAVIVNDVTNRKMADDLLHESERKIKSIIESAPVGIGLIKGDFIVEVNDTVCKMLLYESSELVNFKFENLFYSKEFFYQIWPETLCQITESGIPSLETQWIRKDGAVVTVLLSSMLLSKSDESMGITFTAMDISERKDYENELRKREQKYRELIDFAVGGVLIGSQEGYIIDVNNLACKLLNKSYGQLVGKHIADKLFTNESLKNNPFRFDLLNNGETVVSQREISTSDGSLLTVETHTKQMPDKTYQMILHDITVRKKAEIEIVKREEKFLTAFRENPIPTILTTLEGGIILDINDVCEQISGWKRSEVIGKSTIEVGVWINPNDRMDISKKIKELGAIKNKRTDIYSKEKLKLTVLLSSVTITIDNKLCLLSSAIDITSLFKVQQDLFESEQKYRFLVDNINDLVVKKDSNGIYTYVSDSYCKLFGKTKNEILNNSFVPLVHEEDKQGTIDAMNNLRKEPYTCYFEQRVFSIKGWVWLAWSDKAILNDSGKIESVIGLGRDITERKEMEIQLHIAKDKAEESSRLKTSFLSNMSHEIRTPMNAIMGFAELLKNPELQDSRKNEFLDVIMTSSKQLLTIIDDIIEISRIDSGMMKINKAPFYLNSFFSNLNITMNLLVPKGKNLKLIFNEDVFKNNILVFSDEVKLKQIISNLFTNAIKFTSQGYIECGYTVKNQNILEFFVKDTGIGIDTKFHNSVFERFSQVNNELSWKYSGSGLGLAISKAYVELLGGNIWLNSSLGMGSTFYFTIPFESVEKNFENDMYNTVDFNDFGNGSILIADDNEFNFNFLQNLFLEYNIPVLHAHNGEEAVEMCKIDNSIRIVLMDLKMPIMDGIEASREIIKLYPKMPIIAQTAYTLPDDKERAKEAGCKSFISKPIQRNELFEIISKLINVEN